MSLRYLVPCSCGQKVAVAAAQAGQQVACACGATVEVPPMRRLSHLEKADSGTAVQAGDRWTRRMAVLFLGLVIAVPALGFSGYLFLNRPTVDPEVVRKETEALSLRDAWQLWSYYANNSVKYSLGSTTDLTHSVLAQRERVQSYISIGLVVAAVGLLIAGSSLLVDRPPAPTRRR